MASIIYTRTSLQMSEKNMTEQNPQCGHWQLNINVWISNCSVLDLYNYISRYSTLQIVIAYTDVQLPMNQISWYARSLSRNDYIVTESGMRMYKLNSKVRHFLSTCIQWMNHLEHCLAFFVEKKKRPRDVLNVNEPQFAQVSFSLLLQSLLLTSHPKTAHDLPRHPHNTTRHPKEKKNITQITRLHQHHHKFLDLLKSILKFFLHV